MTDTVRGWPTGTPYQITEPARLAYWDPSELLPARTVTRRAFACDWTPPAPRVQGPQPAPDASLNLFEQMFGADS